MYGLRMLLIIKIKIKYNNNNNNNNIKNDIDNDTLLTVLTCFPIGFPELPPCSNKIFNWNFLLLVIILKAVFRNTHGRKRQPVNIFINLALLLVRFMQHTNNLSNCTIVNFRPQF